MHDDNGDPELRELGTAQWRAEAKSTDSARHVTGEAREWRWTLIHPNATGEITGLGCPHPSLALESKERS